MSELLKISTLARRSGVPAATIKHYLREGLLPEPARRTARNMAYYDAALIERIQTIKRLQRERFLPLGVIRELLESGREADDDVTAAVAIASVLRKGASGDDRTREELLASGVRAAELDWLEAVGLVTPARSGDETRYAADDIALLRTLGAARKAGLDPQMLPTEILEQYVRALRELVRAELSLFRAGVLPRARGDLAELTEVATTLSERLVMLIRRKLLLPTLAELVAEAPQRRQSKRRKR
jgi:DNA-binding transcriptional MerR regulator